MSGGSRDDHEREREGPTKRQAHGASQGRQRPAARGSLPNLSQPRAPETSQLSIMPASPALDEVLAANKAYQASGQHRPNLKLGVSRRLVVLTCMDSR